MPSPVYVSDPDFRHDVDYLVSEANGYQSREVGVVTGGQVLYAGTVLGVVTATGALKRWTPGATDGSQNAAAILMYRTDARNGDVRQTITARQAEVNGLMLKWPDFYGDTGLTVGQRNAAIQQLGGGPRIYVRT